MLKYAIVPMAQVAAPSTMYIQRHRPSELLDLSGALGIWMSPYARMFTNDERPVASM